MEELKALVAGFRNFVVLFKSFCSSVLSVLDYVYSILKTLWFGLTSLLSGLFDLVTQVFTGGIFNLLPPGFNDLAVFIGYPAVIFISSLILLAILRIGVSFVFKLFKLSIDYKTMTNKKRG